MHRREVGISVAAGLVLVVLGLVDPTGIGGLIVRAVAGAAFNFWYVGAAALVLAVVLQSRPGQQNLARILGLVGITWMTFLAGAIGWLLFMLVSRPFGY